ncbi:MAG: hypothetical protein EA397_12985 [Deltaproteobacteria bacterium]|nr:MAG: hypothetical protein EA397_12985 [Deltaproteobacteria bacterium]
MNRSLLLALAAALTFGACNGDDEETELSSESDSDSETEVQPPLVTISGQTLEVLSQDPADDTHCVLAVDPSAAIEGGDLNILGQATVNADGSYAITEVNVALAPLAIFLILQDCDTDTGEPTVFPSATGFAAESYSNAQAGDELTSPILYLSAGTAALIDSGLETIGSDARLEDGSVMAFIQDDEGDPLGGATLTCAQCGDTYYVNPMAADGVLGSSDEDINDATIPGVGLAFIPEGPVGAYQASAEGFTFEPGLFGSIEGIAAFTAFSGTPAEATD